MAIFYSEDSSSPHSLKDSIDSQRRAEKLGGGVVGREGEVEGGGGRGGE